MLPPVLVESAGGKRGLALRLPRVVWIELTSKCPVDCVFCSRKSVRGPGEHMPFDLYTRLLSELDRPAIIRLSYSGESGHYPRLIEAIDAAKATRAQVELVTALVSVPERIVRLMAERLDRITVSIHTTIDDEFRRIYRYGSFAEFERKLAIITELRRQRGEPALDFCFVAMESNISSLDGVVGLARERYVQDVFVQPVMQREAFEYAFPELDGTGRHRRDYAARLRDAVDMVRSRYSGVRVQIVNPAVEAAAQGIGEIEHTGEIIECAEDPWQTMHVLSNGDVTSCGWRQAQPLGNLHSASLREIWNGPPYQLFRRAHRQGCDAVCRRCPFKKSHPSVPLEPRITADRAPRRQLPAGWEEQDGSDSVWAGANAVLEMPLIGEVLHLIGALPPSPQGDGNTLTIAIDGAEIAVIENPSQKVLQFNRVLRLPKRVPTELRSSLVIEFRTQHEYVPREHGQNEDSRRLGFCLGLAECVDAATEEPDVYFELGLDRDCRRRLGRLRAALVLTDLMAPWAKRLSRLRPRPITRSARPGITVVIPERGNPGLLEECLASVDAAGRRIPEALQVIVVANGSQEEEYALLRARYPSVEFECQAAPLTFCSAVRRGIKKARHDWVYLLNNDMTLDPGALLTLAGERRDSVFALASRIVLADRGLLPYETNWTSFRVRDEVFEVYHAPPPDGPGPFEVLFGGGGCTLYRGALLERYLGRFDPYAPFYFEDLDWATRAWQDGFASLLCPNSVATHRHRATINRFYGAAEADRIFKRNLLQYQLRHVIQGVSREAVLRRIALTEPRTIQDLTGWRKIASIALARMASASTSRDHGSLRGR